MLIDIPPQPKRFGDVIEWWQVERNKVMVPAFEFVAGLNPTYTGIKNFWYNMAKGQDKSSYLARLLNWVLAYSKRPLRCYCAAKDADQAGIIRDFMWKESEYNKHWLGKRLEFKTRVVLGKHTGSSVEFLTSDAAGAHGKTPDLLVMDEITHWESDGLFNSLWSAVPKRQGYCVTAILTNAGLIGSWQDELRQLAKASHGKDWYYFEQSEGTMLASWMTPEEIAKQSKLMSKLESDRLFRNRWVDPAEAGVKVFSPSDVDRCVGVPQPPPPGAQVFLSLDYGGVCDRTALTVLWYDTNTQTIHVVGQTVWQGSVENEIRIKDLEAWLELQFAIYPNAVAVVDTLGQLLGTAQEFEDKGHPIIRFLYRGGKQNALMLTTLRSLLTNQRIVFSPDCGMLGGSTLQSELKEVVGKQMTYGERLDHKTSKHDDRCVSLGMGVLAAIQYTMPGAVPQKSNEPPPHPFANQLPRVTNPFDRIHAARRGLFGMIPPASF